MDKVKAQYEAYPYPERNPKDEAKRLITGSPSAVDEINHYLFGGRRDWRQPFHALVAGGGTGDGLIMLAQQLADKGCPAEITYIDLSEASRAIAEARAETRGLTSITFHTGSLLDAADYGPFDYIDCVGVLHHLPDPDAGFAALAKALKPEGGMGIMVYGALGRTGVYDMQDMLKGVTAKDKSPEQEVATAQALLGTLPESNRFKRNPFLSDHKSNAAGLYDLLLHKQDRAYTVPQINDALDAAGLGLAGFVGNWNYDAPALLSDAKLKARVMQLPLREQHAFAELFTGNLSKHVFYAAHADYAAGIQQPSPTEDAIPILQNVEAKPLAKHIATGAPLRGNHEGLPININMPAVTAHVLTHANGRRTFEDIRQSGKLPVDKAEYYRQVSEINRVLGGLNMMLLRYA